MEITQRGHTNNVFSHAFSFYKTYANAAARPSWQGPNACSDLGMSGHERPQLGRVIVTPIATIGVLAAVLMWEIEHVGSVLLALVIAAVAIAVGIVVVRRLRRDIDRKSTRLNSSHH